MPQVLLEWLPNAEKATLDNMMISNVFIFNDNIFKILSICDYEELGPFTQ